MSMHATLYREVEATRREMVTAYNYATRHPGDGQQDDWETYYLCEDRWRQALNSYNRFALLYGWDTLLDDEA
jgi:hypothetical protein